ncbi:UNVERIFIED_CONTAM: hypothetical protein FKN15_050431 [Acipenser sinensis]
MTVIQAMQEYVASVKILDPEWNPKLSDKKGKEQKVGFGGPVVSSLYQEEMIREEDKNIFDYCRENNIEHVTSAIHSKTVDVNLKDEEVGFAPQDWKVLEEDKNIFDYCRENNIEHVTSAIHSKTVDVNLKDEEGRALLHWACDRGHKDLVSVLLQNKANINSQGRALLHWACDRGHKDLVSVLLQNKANINSQDFQRSPSQRMRGLRFHRPLNLSLLKAAIASTSRSAVCITPPYFSNRISVPNSINFCPT